MQKKHIWQSVIAVLAIAVTVVAVDQWNARTHNKLSSENEELQAEIDQLQSENEYVTTKLNEEPAFNADNVKEWKEMDKKAEKIVEESEGKFKKSWALFLVKESKAKEIDPFLVYELLKVETGNTFDPELVGPETKYGHAYGMSQFMTNTAPWIADMANLEYKKEKLFDPYYSMKLSVTYLDFLHQEYEGNWDKALTAYHRGMGGLNQYMDNNGHAKSWYAVEIQSKAQNHTTVAVAN
ncbi:transglycosylase SLT domain-containing protein [Salimicrobium halophilum]|uniref:Transglycosylase SLT domain-containing protein n=1 Tax=Salimicrobium halophilum TaxID=86666 RepID=A0A1G8PS44_9BACI|nr:transglycosylase SLT domain-containing protein [Salimicrobium halophilum]SDI95035.1 Transglycosylase SLT domain-containing protein [Salimicrobium halophilum]